MNTYSGIVHMIMDEIKAISDDAYYTVDHIIFLVDKYRSFLLKKTYSDIKKEIPESNYQTICLDLEEVEGIEGDICSGRYMRSIQQVPSLVDVTTPRISTMNFMQSNLVYASPERMPYVGLNKFLRSITYCTIGPDNKVYLKSNNPQMFFLEKIKVSGVFEDSSAAAELSCNDDGSATNCDVLDSPFALEEALIPQMIELIVKELIGTVYYPRDFHNNAADDQSGSVRQEDTKQQNNK